MYLFMNTLNVYELYVKYDIYTKTSRALIQVPSHPGLNRRALLSKILYAEASHSTVATFKSDISFC